MLYKKINTKVLMSGADYFDDGHAINAYMDSKIPVDVKKAKHEHTGIKKALEGAGVEVISVDPPKNCQDGVYTANWGLCRGDTVVLSHLPNKRKAEETYAEEILKNLGKKTIRSPLPFSGQGDALPCGDLLFIGSVYRTDPKMHHFVEEALGFKTISLQTIPQLNENKKPVINTATGWPDSFFYDIDLALAVISPELIAWCPEAFLPESQQKIRDLSIDKIEVSLKEAKEGFACNLVSTGETVVMSADAPMLQKELETRGFKTITPEISELAKGGGYIRCTSLTLS